MSNKVIVIGGTISVVDRQRFIDAGIEIVYGDSELANKQAVETGEMMLARYDSVRFIENPDCQPALCYIDESQSWQQMNRGNLSKKQRRGKL